VKVIPAIDVLDGAVVRLQKGEYEKVTRYGDEPVAVAGDLVAAGADLIHVVDLAAARSGVALPGLWTDLGAAAIPFQAAGGIRTAVHAEAALGAGAQRIVSGTAVVWNAVALAAMVAMAGDRLVAAVDVKDGRAVGSGWTDGGRALEAVLDDLVAAGVARLMVTAVATDGMLTGPDLPLLEEMLARMETPIIASGGVGTLADIRAVRDLGAEAIVVGRALYEGRFTLGEAINAAA
jgi:phosphoribosylformimino-5-aminoimidazole carboxamide ribotide isomerase